MKQNQISEIICNNNSNHQLANLNNSENNSLLKSIRTNKIKKEKTQMQTTMKEFNILKRNSSVKNLVSPKRNNENEKFDRGEIITTDISTFNKINDKIFEKVEKRTNNTSNNRRDREAKLALRAKSGLSEKNEFAKEKEHLNNSVHLETISEKGKKKKETETCITMKNNNNNLGVILPKINYTSVNNKECNISSSKNEDDKNGSKKEALRKNY